jgi:TPR repeat protein
MEQTILDCLVNKIDAVGQELSRFAEFSVHGVSLTAMAAHADEPLAIVILGEENSGRATFINALLDGEYTAPSLPWPVKFRYGPGTVTAFYKDGGQRIISLAELSALNNRRDALGELWQIEIEFPHELLKSVTIADVPVKEANCCVYTDQRFIKGADAVVLLLPAAGALSGKSAFRSATGLGLRMISVAAVNKMDEIASGDAAEAVLSSVRDALGEKAAAVVGLSSLTALRGHLDKDESLLIKSNWRALETVFQNEILIKRNLHKLNYLLEGLAEELFAIRYAFMEKQKKHSVLCKIDSARCREEQGRLDKSRTLLLDISAEIADYCRKLIEYGNKSARLLLGVLRVFSANDQEIGGGLNTLEKAAEGDSVLAQHILSVLYRDASLGIYDENKSIFWCSRAAAQGYAKAQNNLAFMCECGQGTEIDEEKALYWYKKAAEQGMAVAQDNLGAMYEYGRGCQADEKKAFYWYERAARQGHADAQHNLAVMYEYGQGIQVNEVKAAFWYEQAAVQGYARSQHALAVLHEQGMGVPADIKKARYWYEQAAEQGYARSQYALAVLYEQDKREPVYEQKARYWYEQAAGQGDAEAQHSLAIMCEEGKGGPADEQTALYWYEKAAAQGDDLADRRAQDLRRKISGHDV